MARKRKTQQQLIDELLRQIAAAGGGGKKKPPPKKAPPPKGKPGPAPKPPVQPPPGVPGVPKPPAPPPASGGQPSDPGKGAPPNQGMPGLPAPKPPVPGVMAPPPVPAFSPPRPAGNARPAQAQRPPSGSDYPSGVYPGGAPKTQVGPAPVVPFSIAQNYGSVGRIPGGAAAPQYRPGQKQQASMQGGGFAAGGYLPPAHVNPRTPGQTSTLQGGYRPQSPASGGTRGSKPASGQAGPQGAGQPVLEVDAASGVGLTRADFAYAARYSGLAIMEALSTGDRSKLPNRMHWRTAAMLPVPPGFESIEQFLDTLGYQVDADGNWTKANPVTNFGYGGGAYGGASGGYADEAPWEDYGGGGGWGGGAGAARGYGAAPYGVVNWRIG